MACTPVSSRYVPGGLSVASAGITAVLAALLAALSCRAAIVCSRQDLESACLSTVNACQSSSSVV